MKSSIKQKLFTVAGITAVSMSMGMPSFAQSVTANTAPAQVDLPPVLTPGQAPNSARFESWNMRASQILGKDVENARGEDLGEIRDVIVDISDQSVHYVVLEFGGFLGLGEKLFAYPMEAFDLSGDRGEMILNVPQEKLENAPGFARDTWPNWTEASYSRQVDEYFGTTRANERAITQKGVHMRRVSELLGRDVSDRTGREIGEIQDLVIDIGKGEIAYAVLDFDTDWNVDDKLLPLPMTALTFPGDTDRDLIVDVDRTQLDMARGFEQNLWPDLNASSFRQSMNDYFLALERPPVPGQAGVVNEADLFRGGERSTGTSR